MKGEQVGIFFFFFGVGGGGGEIRLHCNYLVFGKKIIIHLGNFNLLLSYNYFIAANFHHQFNIVVRMYYLFFVCLMNNIILP